VDLVSLHDRISHRRSRRDPHYRGSTYRYRAKVGRQANLDVQYALALAYPTPVIYYRGTGNGVQLEPGGNRAARPWRPVPPVAQLHAREAENPADDQLGVRYSRAEYPAGICNGSV
jgi:hypothetical protein